jgi:CheY-like chemotaxis protein
MSHERHQTDKREEATPGFVPAVLDRLRKEGDPWSLSIHLVENHPDTLLGLFEFLSKLGFNVTASTTGREAMELVRRGHPKVLVADVQLPDVDGLELLEKVKKDLSPETRVILTADGADWRAYRDVLARGGDDLLVKPVTHPMLLRALERVLEAED